MEAEHIGCQGPGRSWRPQVCLEGQPGEDAEVHGLGAAAWHRLLSGQGETSACASVSFSKLLSAPSLFCTHLTHPTWSVAPSPPLGWLATCELRSCDGHLLDTGSVCSGYPTLPQPHPLGSTGHPTLEPALARLPCSVSALITSRPLCPTPQHSSLNAAYV